MSDWETYYKKHASRKPREQLIRAFSLCKEKNSALDLGAGTLVESAYLLESGFKKVTAVDNSPETKTFAADFDPKQFTLEISSFQDFHISENEYDLVNAQYALPFHGPKDFPAFMEKIFKALKPGGIFVGQLFGNRDGWNTPDTKLIFQTEAEARELFAGMEVVEFTEEEKDGNTAAGRAKHWHVFHFIAKKN